MSSPPNIQPGLFGNAEAFSNLSLHTGSTGEGEILRLPEKPAYNGMHKGFSTQNRSYGWITSLVGHIGERVVHALLPNSEHTGSESSFDIQMPSAYQDTPVFIEVKTAQTRNRGVIRTSQVNRYKEVANNTGIYYAQVFYRMRDGRIPSEFNRINLEENFLPVCIYIFPISFIIYLINTIHPTGQKKSTQFYGLTQHRARSIFDMLDNRGLFSDDVIKKYQTRVFTTTHLTQNPEAELHIIDHRETPHILGLVKNGDIFELE